MEYAIDQPVIYECAGVSFTGRIAGHDGDNFIVILDRRFLDGTKAVLVPAGIVRPLTCHWCRDTQRVYATPFTMEQVETDAIPQKDCPYCTVVPASA